MKESSQKDSPPQGQKSPVRLSGKISEARRLKLLDFRLLSFPNVG
jgi:hypothetical protein